MFFLVGRHLRNVFRLLPLFVFGPQLSSSTAQASLHTKAYMSLSDSRTNEFLVKVKSKSALMDLQREFDLEVAPKPLLKTAEGEWYKVSDLNFSLSLGDLQAHVFSDASLNENILHIEENHRWYVLDKTSDPKPEFPPRLPSRKRSDPMLGRAYGLDKIQAAKAWLTTTGSTKVVIADIDTGIDYNHRDLINNIWRNTSKPRQGHEDGSGITDEIAGWDFVNNDPLPWDDNGHGSHTSGIIAATGNNGVGLSGVAQRAQIMALKFLNAEGSGSTEDAIRSINYAVQNGAVILSNSWGGDEYSKALEETIAEAARQNVLFVAAAGNDGTNNDTLPMYPAAYNLPNIIAVAASDKDDLLTEYSNFGVNTVHIAAPGDAIWSTVPDSKYEVNSGTSMACPYVAGAAALLKAYRPNLTAVQMKQILMQSVDKLPDYADKIASGGRLNVARALELAAGL
jgi:subtilisin family serine protease